MLFQISKVGQKQVKHRNENYTWEEQIARKYTHAWVNQSINSFVGIN